MIQGEYGFNNDILINCMVSNEEKHSVIQHEDTHKRTITGSTLGDLIMMLEKSNVVDNSKNWLLVYFVKSIKKMQEQMATYVEMLTILDFQGKDAYIAAVNNLRSNNRLYYKYYYSMYSKVGDQYIFELKKEGKIKKLIELITQIGILSLNIDVTKIPLWEQITEQNINKLFSDEEKRFNFNPNARFSKLTENIFLKKDEEDLDSEIILSIINSSAKSRSLDDTRSIILKIYQDSLVLDRIIKRVEGIELKVYTDIIYNNLDVLSAYPMLEKNSKDNKTTPELESIKELKNKINQNPQKNFLMFYHLLGGFEEFMFCSNMSIQLNQGYLLSRYSDLEEGKDLIAQTSLPIVFCQTKLIKMLYNQLDFKKNRIYVFMENSIINTVDFIEEYFETSKFYIIKTKKYGIFTFNNNKITLIQLVDKSAINKVKYVLNELGYSESKSYISNHDEIKGLTKKIFTTGMSIR